MLSNIHLFVLVFGKHIVIFDNTRYVIILPEAPDDEMERIQNSVLYRYFEDLLTNKYCTVFGIDNPSQIISC